MNAIFGYMDSFDREWAIIESVMDNKLLKLNYAFDKLMMEHQENLIAIENKVLMESGTDDDLTYYYTAEAEEVKEKGKGILGNIIAAVKAFFVKIKEVLFGKGINKDNLPDEVEVPENPEALKKEGNTLIANIKSFFSGKKGALRAVGIAAATAGAVVITKEKIIPTIKDVEKFIVDSGGTLDQAENQADSLSPEDQTVLKKAINHLKSLGGRAAKIVKTLNSDAYKSHVDEGKAKAHRNAGDAARDLVTKLTDRNKEIEDELRTLGKELDETQSKIDPGFLSKLFSQDGRNKMKLESLQKKIKSGKGLSDSEYNVYKTLLQQVSTKDATLATKLKNIMGSIQRLSKEQLENEKKIGKSDKTSIKEVEKASKYDARAAARATKESAEDLITSANVEVDYFMNSLL